MPLKNRNHPFPPGGYAFFQPQTNWHSTAGLTFDQTVDEIIRHRLANPRHSHAWTTERAEIEAELDNYTCVRIANDPNYCTGGQGLIRRPFVAGPTPPPSSPGLAAAVVAGGRKIVSGIGVLVDWLGSGGNAVAHELAEQRAQCCVDCSMNAPGEWHNFFTGPAVAKIRNQLTMKNDMQLSTSQDEKLKVCKACWCVLSLKVHTPIEHVLAHLKSSMEAEMPARCWILNERKDRENTQKTEQLGQ